jgi:hypothetical protein
MYKQILDMNGKTFRTDIIERESDGAFIPVDERNKDYEEYLSWLNDETK